MNWQVRHQLSSKEASRWFLAKNLWLLWRINKGAVHGTCISYACAQFLTRYQPQLFPIAVKLNPLTQFGRIGRAEEIFAHD
jgi:hypothetical protein